MIYIKRWDEFYISCYKSTATFLFIRVWDRRCKHRRSYLMGKIACKLVWLVCLDFCLDRSSLLVPLEVAINFFSKSFYIELQRWLRYGTLLVNFSFCLIFSVALLYFLCLSTSVYIVCFTRILFCILGRIRPGKA